VKDLKVLYRNSNRKVAHIVVSHGSFVKAFAKFSGGMPGSLCAPIEKINYCGVAAIHIDGNKLKLCMDGNNAHLREVNEKADEKIREHEAQEGKAFENREFAEQLDK